MTPVDIGLIPTKDVRDMLKISTATLTKLRRYGLRQLGIGKQKFYHGPDIVRAMKAAAMVERACRPEND